MGECSNTCGGGTKIDRRSPSINAAFGGEICLGPSNVTETCNSQECPGKKLIHDTLLSTTQTFLLVHILFVMPQLIVSGETGSCLCALKTAEVESNSRKELRNWMLHMEDRNALVYRISPNLVILKNVLVRNLSMILFFPPPKHFY